MSSGHFPPVADLDGKVAVVTGASKGIGAGIARQLAERGARIIVNYSRTAESADQVVNEIIRAGGEAKAIKADMAQPSEIRHLFSQALEAYGRVDILVNNAGIAEFGNLSGITADSIDRMFALNVKGLILATQAAADIFPADGGVVVNISSGAGVNPVPFGQVYGATKAAVDNLTRSLALELGARNIRVVGIAPGAVQTEGTGELDQQTAAMFLARTPLGRIGRPADIASAVAFAVSDEGRWITGETLQVAGGMRM